MASQGSILLMIKQSPGIPYNSLLSKISGNYSNINSARAALSRTVKYNRALGLIDRRGHQLYLTEKGTGKLGAEMKNKLVLQLNRLLQDELAYERIDPIIEHLSTLIARSREDSDLLQLARTSAEFSIADIEYVSEKLEKKILHWNYLKGILDHHIQSMRALDFSQRVDKKFNEKTMKKLQHLLHVHTAADFFMEAPPEFLTYVQEKIGGERKGQHLFFPANQFLPVLTFLKSLYTSEKTEHKQCNIFFSGVRLYITRTRISITGLYSKLKELED